MPIKYFRFEGKQFEINEVLEKGLLSNYFPLAYLKECAKQRAWEGVPSVTQCLNGTRMEYLKILCDYSIDPTDQAFRIIGSRAHKKLEELAPLGSFAELKIHDADKRGTMDLMEQQPNGEWWLVDYKTSGAYKIKKALGLVKKSRPAVDQDGNPILYRRSYKGKYNEGDPKMEYYYEADPAEVDMEDWILQLNRYRMFAESLWDVTIARLKIFAIVRDGGTATARGYGIEAKTYFIDIPFVDNKDIERFFTRKEDLLKSHLSEYEKTKDVYESIPDMCSEEECWNGRRCKDYCEVADFCRMKNDNRFLKDE